MKTEEFKFENGLCVNVIPALKKEESWFVANDICAALEFTHITRSLEILDEDEKQMIKVEYKGQLREVYVISESGLYALVLSSTKPEAKLFRKWITSEVLPSLRIAGKYTTAKAREKQLKLQEINREIVEIDLKIEELKKQTRAQSILREEKYKSLRINIDKDDSQLGIDFEK
jgi:prophage antirepressor-like protein